MLSGPGAGLAFAEACAADGCGCDPAETEVREAAADEVALRADAPVVVAETNGDASVVAVARADRMLEPGDGAACRLWESLVQAASTATGKHAQSQHRLGILRNRQAR